MSQASVPEKRVSGGELRYSFSRTLIGGCVESSSLSMSDGWDGVLPSEPAERRPRVSEEG